MFKYFVILRLSWSQWAILAPYMLTKLSSNADGTRRWECLKMLNTRDILATNGQIETVDELIGRLNSLAVSVPCPVL